MLNSTPYSGDGCSSGISKQQHELNASDRTATILEAAFFNHSSIPERVIRLFSSQTRNIICGTGIGKNTLSADNL